MAKKKIGAVGRFEQLKHLFLSDNSVRWKGLLIIIAVGTGVGSVDLLSGDSSLFDAMTGMVIAMLLTAICLLFFYSLSHRTASADEGLSLRAPLLLAGAGCSFAVVFGSLTHTYQANSLQTQFGKAIEAHDYARVVSISEHATTRSATWNAVLISLKTIPASLQVNQWKFTPKEHAIKVYPNATIVGGNFNVSAVTEDAIELGVATVNVALPPPTIDGTVIQGGRQTLDGFRWKNVTFVGMRISYKGGAVQLEAVKFVNCTFDLPRNPSGAKLAQYVALDLPQLEVGGPSPLS